MLPRYLNIHSLLQTDIISNPEILCSKLGRWVKTGVKVAIIHMKKLLNSDWLRAVQFKCNTSAKSVTSVQITHCNSG